MKIRTATADDATQIARVQVESWRTTYKGIVPDSFLDGMSYVERTKRWQKISVEQTVFVAETDGGEIVGFSNGGRERQGKFAGYDGELYAIYILQAYQGKGIGKQLTKAVVDSLLKKRFHSMLIRVLKDNPAIYFYESIGGEKVGTAELDINGVKLTEIAYGWKDLHQFEVQTGKGGTIVHYPVKCMEGTDIVIGDAGFKGTVCWEANGKDFGGMYCPFPGKL